jgi:hypothetical protein
MVFERVPPGKKNFSRMPSSLKAAKVLPDFKLHDAVVPLPKMF